MISFQAVNRMALDAAPRRRNICNMKKLAVMMAELILFFFLGPIVLAQESVPPPGPAGPTLAPEQLDQLVGPIALYPDPLIVEILPAATQPGELVLANR